MRDTSPNLDSSFDEPNREGHAADERAGASPPSEVRSTTRQDRDDGLVPSASQMMPNDYPPSYAPSGSISSAESARRRTPAWVKMLGGCLILGVVVTVVLACAVGTTAWAFLRSTPASATTTQTFAVSGVPSVNIHSSAGNIHIVRGEAGTVAVQATKYARALSTTGAQDQLRQMTVVVTQSGATLDVRVTEPQFASHLQLWDDRHVDLLISVPAQVNIAATLDAGNVDVADVTGTVGIHDDAGNLSLNDVTFIGSSFATDNAGNIDVTGALQPGASFAARNNAGNVTATLPRDTSAHLTASTDAGNITVASVWPVSISRDAASGSATGDLMPNPTGTLVLRTDAGNVTLEAQES